MPKLSIAKSFLISFCVLTAGKGFAQKNEQTFEKHKPSVMVGVSELKFFGAVGSNAGMHPLLDTRPGYFLSIEQRFGKIFGIELTGIYGQLAGTDYSLLSRANFQSHIMQGHVMITANFDKIMKENPSVSPFLNIGLGYMTFTSYADNKDANGKNYNYWKDGSVRDQPDSIQYASTAQVVKRDFTYETKLKTNNVTGCLVVPMGGGLNFHMGRRWTTSLGLNYTMCFTQWIDNVGTKNNSYLSANFGLQYEFKKADPKDQNYKNVDFSAIDKMDVDRDGVADDIDKCLGTPAGVKVDRHGCPIDTDGDGVGDYFDKEPNSKKGAIVDGYGVTINELEIAKHQKEWDSLSGSIHDEFFTAPSKAALEKAEADYQKARAEGKLPEKKIPEELKVADFNKDGYISAAEITEAINQFFEGNHEFTIDLINRIIEYFFD